MKKIFFLLTILISSNVFAEWVFIGGTDDGSSMFIDKDTILKESHKVKLWKKINYGKTEIEVLSTRSYEEFDCKKRTKIVLSVSGFTEFNFEGKMITSFNPPPKIDYIAPGSMDELMYNYVCK